MNNCCDIISRVDFVDGVYLKRNDEIEIFDVNGGKAIGAFNLINYAINNKYKAVVSLGSRISPQCKIISNICENLQYDCHLFMSVGQDTDVIKEISKNKYTILHRIKYGYNSNLAYNAKKFSDFNNYYFIPFGMKCAENINLISKQVSNIPQNVKRIVVPIGSGVTFCGILQGLNDCNKLEVELLGIETGSSSKKFIHNHLPIFNQVKFKILTYKEELSPSERYKQVEKHKIGNIILNETYEGKCFDFIEKGDLFWIVGK